MLNNKFFLCGMVSFAILLPAAAEQRTWTGASDSDWSNAANWDGGTSVPGASDDVVVPDTANDPEITGAVAIKSLMVASGAVVSPALDAVMTATGSLGGSGTIKVTRTADTADLVSQYAFGSYSLGAMTVDYAGAGDQSINRFEYGSLKTSGSGTKTFISSPGSETRIHQDCEVGEGTTLNAASLLVKLDGASASLSVNGTLDFTSSAGKIRTEAGVTSLSMGPNGLIRTADGNGLGPAVNASLQTQSTGVWDLSGLASAGTVEYVRAGNQIVTGHAYHHLMLSGSGTKTLEAGAAAEGNLEVSGSAKLELDNIGDMSLQVGGNATFAADSTFVVEVGTSPSCDKLIVAGTLALGGATLDIGTLDTPGRTIAIATNGLSGTFNNYAVGGTVQTGYFIHYEYTQTPKHITINQNPSPTSSGIDLRAYQAADGTYAEFIAYDVEDDGTIELQLLDTSDAVVWSGSVDVTAGPRSVARFLVPGLELGETYSFRVRDEVGKWWDAPGITVGGFNAEMTSLSLAGITLSFDSLPDHEYDIQWTGELGGTWQTVTNVTATVEQTSVVVAYPEGTESSGFFRVRMQ